MFCIKELWFFYYSNKHKHKQHKEDTWQSNSFTLFFKVIPFSKYFSFPFGVVLVHGNCANLIDCVNAAEIGVQLS